MGGGERSRTTADAGAHSFDGGEACAAGDVAPSGERAGLAMSSPRQIRGDDPVGESVALGHAAATVMARAIARGIWEAEGAPGDIVPTFRTHHRV